MSKSYRSKKRNQAKYRRRVKQMRGGGKGGWDAIESVWLHWVASDLEILTANGSVHDLLQPFMGYVPAPGAGHQDDVQNLTEFTARFRDLFDKPGSWFKDWLNRLGRVGDIFLNSPDKFINNLEANPRTAGMGKNFAKNFATFLDVVYKCYEGAEGGRNTGNDRLLTKLDRLGKPVFGKLYTITFEVQLIIDLNSHIKDYINNTYKTEGRVLKDEHGEWLQKQRDQGKGLCDIFSRSDGDGDAKENFDNVLEFLCKIKQVKDGGIDDANVTKMLDGFLELVQPDSSAASAASSR